MGPLDARKTSINDLSSTLEGFRGRSDVVHSLDVKSILVLFVDLSSNYRVIVIWSVPYLPQPLDLVETFFSACGVGQDPCP